MILDLIFLVVGLGLLVYAADNFVLGSARLASLLDMSPVEPVSTPMTLPRMSSRLLAVLRDCTVSDCALS